MLNFPDGSVPTASQAFFMALLRRCGAPANWLLPKHGGLREERACCVSRKLRGGWRQRRGEGRRERPGCSARVDLSAVMLSNSRQRRTAGGNREEKDHRVGGGGPGG